jgi:hypothetical protein
MSQEQREMNARASARSYHAAMVRLGDWMPSEFDAADRCGFANFFGDGAERKAFIAEWLRLDSGLQQPQR